MKINALLTICFLFISLSVQANNTDRELEMQRLVKEAEQKRTHYRKESEKREAQQQELEKKELKEIKQKRQSIEELLRQKLSSRKKYVEQEIDRSDFSKATSIDDAIDKTISITAKFVVFGVQYTNDTKSLAETIYKFYLIKIADKYKKKEKAKSTFETEKDYKNRQEKYGTRMNELKNEMHGFANKIQSQYDTEYLTQIKPFLDYQKLITNQLFPISFKDVKFNLERYDSENKHFIVITTVKLKKHKFKYLSLLPFPENLSREYGEHQELLIPDVKFRVTERSRLRPGSISFISVDKEYKCKGNISMDGVKKWIVKDNLVSLDDSVVVDLYKNIMWPAKMRGYSLSWHEAKTYCQNYQNYGYSDWRMPTSEELKSIFDTTPQKHPIYFIPPQTKLVKLEFEKIWASDEKKKVASYINFLTGRINGKYKKNSASVLPVRDMTF